MNDKVETCPIFLIIKILAFFLNQKKSMHSYIPNSTCKIEKVCKKKKKEKKEFVFGK